MADTTVIRVLSALLAAAMVVPLVMSSAASTAQDPPAFFLVTFEDEVDEQGLEDAGGTVQRVIHDFGIALASTTNPLLFMQMAQGVDGVLAVEHDGTLFASGSTWDGSTWDGSTWDATLMQGSTWDGSTWDGSTWDGSTWDGSTWDASTWDGSTWDGSTWDGSTWDASTWDGSTWDGSTWDGGPFGLPESDPWTAPQQREKPHGDDRDPDVRVGTVNGGSAYGAEDPLFRESWGLGAVNAPDAWATTRGDHAAVVCVLDTGVDPDHPDLKPNLWREDGVAKIYSAMLNNDDPRDDVGHGTHVAGIAAAVTGNAWGASGLGQHVILSVKVMDADGGTESDLAEGLKMCMKAGADVATMSLHTTDESVALERAVEKAQEKGVVIVAASGNSGGNHVNYPAAYPGVIAVGAVAADGTVAGFSNGGTNLDLVAPGVRIASTYPDGGFAVGSGTSQAVPFVASAVALARDVMPELTVDQVRTALRASARDIGFPGFDTQSGFGALDAGAFLDEAALELAGGGT